MNTQFQKEIDSFKNLGFLNQFNLSEEDASSLATRYSVRAVILLDDDKIVLVKVSTGNYHSIAGGGIEEGEGIEEAMHRECLEESGYEVSTIKPIGYLEYWKKKYKKFDFCYLVKAIGEQKSLSLTEEEIKIGHEVEEYTIDEAMSILENEVKIMNSPVSERSLIFLKEAKNILEDMVK